MSKLEKQYKRMKNAALIIVVSVLSSFSTIWLYKTFLEEKAPSPKLVKNEVNSEFVSNKNNLEPSDQKTVSYTSSAPTNFTRAAKKSAPAVVHIRSIVSRQGGQSLFEDIWGRSDSEASSGSGVIISSDGYIVTNNHVIEDGNKFKVNLQNRQTYEATVIGTDPSTDIALLKIEGENFPYISLSDSDSAKIGEWVLAVGNPFNLTSTVTAGIVSAKGRNIDILDGEYSIESFIQTDAAVNPGNSGGALVNTNGDLVGINTAIITRSGRYEGYSFAVPSNLVKKVVGDLKEFGIVQRGFLGVSITDITEEIAKQNKISNREGVYIRRVNPESAAEVAGLKTGDIILNINGKKIRSTPELQEVVARYRPGNPISIKYLRNGKLLSGTVILRNQNNSTNLIEKKEVETMDDLGFELRELNKSELGRFKMNGVMVVSISRGSIIDRTNMEPGFLINKINGTSVSTIEELTTKLSTETGKITLEGVYRDYKGEYFYTFVK